MVVDVAHPSPSIGVNNQERTSFTERAKVDIMLALALIHHLSIGKNIPFNMIFDMLAKMCSILIIEFVPKDDEKVKLMLTEKKDIYPHYNRGNFEFELKKKFTIEKAEEISKSGRILFLARRI